MIHEAFIFTFVFKVVHCLTLRRLQADPTSVLEITLEANLDEMPPA